MVAATLSGLVLLGVLSTFLFLGRSGANLRNYNDMEAQARTALELFAEDTRQASSVNWASANSLTLRINTTGVLFVDVTYTYDPTARTFSRTRSGTTTRLVTGITEFSLLAYTITGAPITDFNTATARAVANSTTKQVQISLSASRTSSTVKSATNLVLSARYVLRNKRVTA
jgi:Tfp pilus assembly protein PilW